MKTFIKKFEERFGYQPMNVISKAYTTHIGLRDISYSATAADGNTYTWSAAYGWDDED